MDHHDDLTRSDADAEQWRAYACPPGLDRPEVFIETKVWITDYGYDQTLHAFDKSAVKLGVQQLDLLILHQPLPSAFDRTIAACKALERLVADGKVRAIGVSNFMPDHAGRPDRDGLYGQRRGRVRRRGSSRVPAGRVARVMA